MWAELLFDTGARDHGQAVTAVPFSGRNGYPNPVGKAGPIAGEKLTLWIVCWNVPLFCQGKGP